jgi:hypothetical protein
VAKVYDTAGKLSYYGDPSNPQADKPDGFLGPYKTSGTAFEINQSAFEEIRGSMWYGRMRPKPKAGGGSVE